MFYCEEIKATEKFSQRVLKYHPSRLSETDNGSFI